MGQILSYTRMLLRAYTRDWVALFFGFFFPLIFMGLFGILNFGSFGHVGTGIVDNANNADSQAFRGALAKVETLKITVGTLDDELTALKKGDRDIVLVIPADFKIAPARPGSAVPTLTMYENQGRGQEVAVGSAILTQVIDQMSFAVTQSAPIVTTKVEEVAGRNLKYVDFLTPGIVGMTIMQLGIAGVMFTFVVDRQRGVIRRIMATPISRRNYMAAHVLERLILAVLQVLILLAVAVFAFKVTIVGSLGTVLLMSVLGSVMFLCFGFAVTGFVTTENQAPAIMQLVTLPQMFLSGVFFSRDAVPAFLKPVSDVLPLTFLNDALRQISTAGATLGDLPGDVIGIVVWSVITFVIAFRFFKLET
ncbi:MAG TPA: ABC transporter permease [Methylomirabilota bacterium]|nr:ABC transporter permease [Methylomirabilota bacterium]